MPIDPSALNDETRLPPTLWVCVTAEQWAQLMLLREFMERVEFPPLGHNEALIGPPMLGRVYVIRDEQPIWLLFFEAQPTSATQLANIASHFGGDLSAMADGARLWRPDR